MPERTDSPTMLEVQLMPHPSSPESPIDSLTVHLERDGLALWLRFVAEGRMPGVVWPGPVEPGRTDDLWRHSCFEAFVEADGGYVEYNLSPSGQWASYRFDSPRQGMRSAQEVATPGELDLAQDMLALETRIELPNGARRLGLSAVIESVDGSFSYWALAHPSDKPDFHHPDSFVLELP
ncbi:DOMON-like domain-containing protein [Brevundimonas balnearis]|uniref:DOMON-like domain-containing protein n=1 Tax=Brevundimonas balnearis TaxID=1572858 RepID=A0ABV6QYU8_9CAUL